MYDTNATTVQAVLVTVVVIGIVSAGLSVAGAATAPTTGTTTAPPGSSAVVWSATNTPQVNESVRDRWRDEPRPLPVVGDQPPTDPDGDGLYEDVNGNGKVTVVDSDALLRHLASPRVGAHWQIYDFTDDGRTDQGDVLWLFERTLATPITDSDGDGLPDRFERTATGTDPALTDTDGDGTIDSVTDRDGDGLIAFTEYRIGTDPDDADTDGDGYRDGYERVREALDPTTPDDDRAGLVDEMVPSRVD